MRGGRLSCFFDVDDKYYVCCLVGFRESCCCCIGSWSSESYGGLNVRYAIKASILWLVNGHGNLISQMLLLPIIFCDPCLTCMLG
jgi:hypothetical protein